MTITGPLSYFYFKITVFFFNLMRRVTLFFIFANLFNVCPTRRQILISASVFGPSCYVVLAEVQEEMEKETAMHSSILA